MASLWRTVFKRVLNTPPATPRVTFDKFKSVYGTIDATVGTTKALYTIGTLGVGGAAAAAVDSFKNQAESAEKVRVLEKNLSQYKEELEEMKRRHEELTDEMQKMKSDNEEKKEQMQKVNREKEEKLRIQMRKTI
ncbi:hypothetical protein ACE6H2_008772 [Prunus campanulata]